MLSIGPETLAAVLFAIQDEAENREEAANVPKSDYAMAIAPVVADVVAIQEDQKLEEEATSPIDSEDNSTLLFPAAYGENIDMQEPEIGAIPITLADRLEEDAFCK